MKWTICFRVPKDEVTIDGHRRICFTIPVLIDKYWLRNPNPPDPFVTHFDAESTRHLQTLATIDQFAAELPAEVSSEIQRSVATHMQALGQKLGEGIEITRYATKA